MIRPFTQNYLHSQLKISEDLQFDHIIVRSNTEGFDNLEFEQLFIKDNEEILIKDDLIDTNTIIFGKNIGSLEDNNILVILYNVDRLPLYYFSADVTKSIPSMEETVVSAVYGGNDFFNDVKVEEIAENVYQIKSQSIDYLLINFKDEINLNYTQFEIDETVTDAIYSANGWDVTDQIKIYIKDLFGSKEKVTLKVYNVFHPDSFIRLLFSKEF